MMQIDLQYHNIMFIIFIQCFQAIWFQYFKNRFIYLVFLEFDSRNHNFSLSAIYQFPVVLGEAILLLQFYEKAFHP